MCRAAGRAIYLFYIIMLDNANNQSQMNNSNLTMTDTSRNEVKLIASVQKGMTSLEIAEVTGKQHAHVMRDIRNLLSQGVAESNFGLGSYTDANNQERPLFNLTPKGCLILGLPFGRNTLFKKLREAGVLFANRNEPKQKYIDAGYFEIKEKPIPRENHPGFVVMVVLCTQKGLAYINHLFGGKPSDGKLMKIS